MLQFITFENIQDITYIIKFNIPKLTSIILSLFHINHGNTTFTVLVILFFRKKYVKRLSNYNQRFLERGKEE